jgi:hypothetical protein
MLLMGWGRNGEAIQTGAVFHVDGSADIHCLQGDCILHSPRGARRDERETVCLVRVSDGHNGRTIAVSAEFPLDITFDGTNLWAVSASAHLVNQLRDSNGRLLRPFTIVDPIGVIFDETSTWVTSGTGNSVSKITVSP